ncbi:hypothetical protein BDV96DRAFT_641599 [Lophiotrema nucula]|uniref:Uncharacterized protein n=1 Tax=Lophiotrema nucula TaxID=690887 RepID=A0A6A5ZPZ4_9PLEO|nr:hypothetical protein BDV96DRAFT_641599 [Lophiotrema nucula]
MADPTIAPYYGLFVTAGLPVQTVNAILSKANDEYKMYSKLPDAEQLFGNCWALVETRDQIVFQKPTRGPLNAYKSEFLNASIDEIGEFVERHFGKTGAMESEPDDPNRYIAKEVFGILDSRTAEDETLLFVARESITAEDEAQIRTKTSLSYLHHIDNVTQETRTDPILSPILRLNAQRSGSYAHPMTLSTEASLEDRDRLKAWYEGMIEDYKEVWAGIRLDSNYAFSSIGGILYRGVADYLLFPEDDFDETGVLKGGAPY